MNSKLIKELGKVAAGAGALAVLTRLASKIPGPVGLVAKAVVFGMPLVAPMFKKK